MEEQVKPIEQSESGTEVVNNDSGIDYISAINEIKKNTVSREKYEKLEKENQELLDSLINGGQIVVESQANEPNIEELRNSLFGKEAVDKGMTNLEFVEKSLKLRDAIISNGGTDPFLPVGKGIEITREDYESAEYTAQQFRECIEVAQGNSEVFTAELMRRTVDNSLHKTSKNNSYYRR